MVFKVSSLYRCSVPRTESSADLFAGKLVPCPLNQSVVGIKLSQGWDRLYAKLHLNFMAVSSRRSNSGLIPFLLVSAFGLWQNFGLLKRLKIHTAGTRALKRFRKLQRIAEVVRFAINGVFRGTCNWLRYVNALRIGYIETQYLIVILLDSNAILIISLDQI